LGIDASPANSDSRPIALRAPLVPVALAVAIGVWFERIAHPPAGVLIVGLIGLAAAWLLAQGRRKGNAAGLTAILLWSASGLLAASWHRVCLAWPGDAIGHFAGADRILVRIKGTVEEDVALSRPLHPELCSPPAAAPRSAFLVRVAELQLAHGWIRVDGLVRVWAEGELSQLRIGEGVQIVGALSAFTPPANPGDEDFPSRWIGRGIQASLHVKSLDAIGPAPEHSRMSLGAMMSSARAAIGELFRSRLTHRQAGIGHALICGEQSALAPDQFEGYLQTGVYHVLAVSGQHLVILGAFVGFCLRFAGGSIRSRAVWLAIFVLAYMLLTGARPPVVRAAAMVCAWCLGLWLLRPAQPLNLLAFAWIIVAIWNPGDLANTGCQLSFIAVLVLIEVVAPLYQRARRQSTPLDRLEERLRPASLRLLHWLGTQVRWGFIIALIVWLATAPLIAQRFHLFSPVAVLLTPFLAVTVTIALLSGMLLVLCGGIPLVSALPASWMGLALDASDMLVTAGRALPGGFVYCPDLPDWWVAIFYFTMIAVVITPGWRVRWKLWLTAAGLWFLWGLGLAQPIAPGGLRMTVLSIGHGTAIVLETPDGRCLLYDAGSLSGPEVAQRQVSAYLWSRGRTKIDEVILSHADLDHFNGLIELADRFRIGAVRLTPTFADKPDRGTQATIRYLEKTGIPMRRIHQGEVLRAGEVVIEALHPPAGPAPALSGPENIRSLVLRIAYQGRSILLTGDLEQAGLEMVTSQPIEPVDVLVAPHHGSRISNTGRFAAWCRPGLAISSETFPRGPKPDPYSPLGATYWRTWVHGAVTVQILDGTVQAWTHLTHRRWGREH
jgi:competence protein ComEC